MPRFGEGSWEKNAGWMSGEKPVSQEGQGNSVELAKRIGVIGHSLGGHNAIFTATFDERLKAVVTSCGFTGFRNLMLSSDMK